MSWRIIRFSPQPPGGFVFTDPRVPAKKFGKGGGKDDLDNEVLEWRLLNPQVYPPSEPKFLTREHVSAETHTYNCNRLGNNPKYCKDDNAPKVRSIAGSTTCPACGGALAPVYCATCSGKKIKGYTCQNCKKRWPK